MRLTRLTMDLSIPEFNNCRNIAHLSNPDGDWSQASKQRSKQHYISHPFPIPSSTVMGPESFPIMVRKARKPL